MGLVNSWTIENQSFEGEDHKKIRVVWKRTDDADPKVLTPEHGEFVYTIVAGNTWTVTEAAIETKVTAKEGQEM